MKTGEIMNDVFVQLYENGNHTLTYELPNNMEFKVSIVYNKNDPEKIEVTLIDNNGEESDEVVRGIADYDSYEGIENAIRWVNLFYEDLRYYGLVLRGLTMRF